MDTQLGYKQLRYTVWTVSHSNQIPSGIRGHMTLLNRTLFCVFGVMQCVYAV